MSNVPPTSFKNVQVTAIPEIDSVTKKVKYKTSFDPDSLTITEFDTVINYQLISPTPADVTIKKVTFKPVTSNQFSEPSIGDSGKIVTFSDANTAKETFNLTLHFADSDGVEFLVDPEVTNEPPVPPM
ncbi:hypothetical protein GCM10027277_09020 [Pseudoduganella ginsengisoli]|uniref:Uncharacterized protein n=1 Tax=Pseudoduganella ginsengisoli TaxID=1462440 RepID=A0A6L6Q0J8_9BURK|nr:hypothetical protein [Pseudoduganella ginsengisoli]MTW03160.1 hypothetical protein [Pseudoduganella ginsengisoli]